MNIQVVTDTIDSDDLREIAEEFYRSMIKGAIDIEKSIVAFGGEYHIDASNRLSEMGAQSKDIWGFNIRLDAPRDSWVEYTALINIKPEAGNRDMIISDAATREKIKKILDTMII
ncbi:MAG TPA: DUF5674 family protein [Candidatus Paceibacterota bacterium]